jgi:hypothetical protein
MLQNRQSGIVAVRGCGANGSSPVGDAVDPDFIAVFHAGILDNQHPVQRDQYFNRVYPEVLQQLPNRHLRDGLCPACLVRQDYFHGCEVLGGLTA